MNYLKFIKTFIVVFTTQLSFAQSSFVLPPVCNCLPTGTAVLNCNSVILSPPVYLKGVTYSGTASLPYTGGNGGTYTAGSVASTGITGFTASWPAGTLATGAGTILITITGSSPIEGPASFSITIAGQTCNVSLTTCGAPTNSGGFLVFMCHNLGADYSADPFTPSWQLNGAYFQWGKKPVDTNGDGYTTKLNSGSEGFAAAPTDATAGGANSASIPSWSIVSAPTNAWNVNEATPIKTANDPCPNGYRVPTRNEWVSIYTGVTGNWSNVGGSTWTASSTNYSTGKNINNTLYLPAQGSIVPFFGNSLFRRGLQGYYWSSTNDLTTGQVAYSLEFGSNFVSPMSTTSNNVFNGRAVRCIKQ